MRLNLQEGYALELLAGLDDATEIVRLPLLAAHVGVPLAAARRVMERLVAARLVQGRRGRTGGYRLARPLQQITLGQVIQALSDRGEGAAGLPSDVAQRASTFLELETSAALAAPVSRFLPEAAAV